MQSLNPTMDAETFAAAAEAQKPLIGTADTASRGLGSMSRQRWETLTKQLVELGVIQAAPAADACFVELAPSSMAPGPATAPSNAFTHTLTRDEPYYLTGPQQGRPPEGTFKKGTNVKLVESAGSYTRVTAGDGTTAWIAADALLPKR